MRTLLLYFLAVPIFFGIDMVWIGVIANRMYMSSIPKIRQHPNWFATILFYLLYIIGILIFAVLPNVDKDWTKALIYGALFGFFAYATYDLTNFATIEGWPIKVTIIDLVWGTVLTGIVSVIMYFIANKIL